ncbi:hypothetical protein DFH06DRAFT_1132006 [Mycena polygramma]|nr:hypothetical protein DFH06DRAFT_1132006 [Mycena polygramma]
MIEAAIAGGVRHFIPSEFGADIAQDGLWKNRYFRDKVVTRDHLRARAKDTPGFQYTLILSGAVAEYTVSEFNGVDVQKHIARTYGYPEARLHVTAMHDVAKLIVGSVLLPFEEPSQPMRELRVSGDCLTWKALMALLEEAQGVKYDITYLDPAEAAEKQEAARADGDTEGELMWSACAMMANGLALLPGPSDNHRFAFKPETAKETLTRMFAKKRVAHEIPRWKGIWLADFINEEVRSDGVKFEMYWNGLLLRSPAGKVVSISPVVLSLGAASSGVTTSLPDRPRCFGVLARKEHRPKMLPGEAEIAERVPFYRYPGKAARSRKFTRTAN